MKKLQSLIITIFLLIIVFAFNTEESAIDKIRKNDHDRYQKFKYELSLLYKVISQSQEEKEIKKIRDQYQNVRAAYKSWEYLAEYYHGPFIKEYINGVPLPKLENNSFAANIIQPKGLQVIDELLYADVVLQNKEELLNQIDGMIKQLNTLSLPNFHTSQVFIASRQELVRIISLGITGFDVPGSSNVSTIKDVQNSLISINKDISLINENLPDEIKKIFDSCLLNLYLCIKYLDENRNYKQFNRFEFTQKFINPLYAQMLQLHQVLQYEFPQEISPQVMPVNYFSEKIFSEKFLNPNYYTNLPSAFINDKTKELGKILFFDPILSANNERSCASCHNPAKGFTDQLEKSIAYNFNGNLKRNSPTLINSVFSDRYFHDLRANNLTDQMEHVITNTSEFNTNWNKIIEKLNSSTEYVNLYKSAFGKNANINIQYTQFAMSAYVGSLNSFNSKFDQLINSNKTTFDKEERKIIAGYNLFMGKANCGTCHFAPIFNGTVPPLYIESESEVLGVAENPMDKKQYLSEDKGRGNAVLKEQVEFYEYSFKTPTIRNIDLTFPYMHNGAYKTLEDVMNFYNLGGGAGFGINLAHQTLSDEKLNLTKSEIDNIITFMKSLTDTVNLNSMPNTLPKSNIEQYNNRIIGGKY